MKQKASYTTHISDEDRLNFAEISGDFNPMHVDEDYAKKSEYKNCILHGAFSAGLVSRMAGMHIPGKECLLHNINLKFLNPIKTPIEVEVIASVNRDDGLNGEASIEIRDKETLEKLVTGTYNFGRHSFFETEKKKERVSHLREDEEESILITGPSGGLGSALINQIGSNAIGVSRSDVEGCIKIKDLENIEESQINNIKAIVHCAWPKPINDQLTNSSSNLQEAVEYHISRPLREVISLAKILKEKGTEGAQLILVGSEFSKPGRHAWSMPYYSISKSMIPNLVKILALELAPFSQKVVGISFDMLDGGMNTNMTKATKIQATDRTLSGILPNMNDAANDIKWVLDNNNKLISGAMIELSGGAIP